MPAPNSMQRLKLFSTLRPAGLWLIVLMCLSLAQPLLSLAGPAPQETNLLEFKAPDFDAELLDSPVEQPGSTKHSLYCPEAGSVPSRIVLADQLTSGRSDYLRITISSRWLATSPTLFFPRPPPQS